MGRGRVAPQIKNGDWGSVRRAIARLSTIILGSEATPTFTGLTLTGLTANRLIKTDGDSALAASGITIDSSDNLSGIGTLDSGVHTIMGGATEGLVINQGADSKGWIVNGYDSQSNRWGKGYVDANGAFTLDAATFYLFRIGGLVKTLLDPDEMRIYRGVDVIWGSAFSNYGNYVWKFPGTTSVDLDLYYRIHGNGETKILNIDEGGVFNFLKSITIGDGGATNFLEISTTGLPTLHNGQELRFNDIGDSNYVGFKAPALTANQIWTLPIADGDNDDIIKTDGNGILSFVTPTSHTQLSFSMYDAEPARGSETSLDGAFLSIATGQPLNSVPTDLVVSKGTGKIIVVVNAGSDFAGDITVTGTSVDRDTGATTGSDTDTLTIDALTTDDSDTDTNGNIRHAFTGAYITSKWFTGTVTLSTTNLTLTDVDVYHVSFEQFDGTTNITLDTFDANILTTNVNAEFDAYLYSILVTGDKCNIVREASLNVGVDGETAIADRYWRLRRGNINKVIDGTTDGTWVDVHYSNSPAYVEDVSIKIWATEVVSLTLD
jgi:hypothetical protein